MQNQAINIGIAFYGTKAREVGNLHVGAATDDNAGTNDAATDFTTYIHPTSRRNVREGLCRLGKDWTYYAGHHWFYDTKALDDNSTPGASRGDLLDADQADGHQFYDERESWYNGMRPNGFPQERHGGKGTESVCHFCCDPAVEGQWCNRRSLDGVAQTVTGFAFSAGTGKWRTSTNSLAAPRADNEALKYSESPAMSSWLTTSPWLSKMRYHGQWRNPETQVSQNFATAGGR